jgi:hypothetical protein
MAVTILNYFEADRRTVIADEAMDVGDVVKIVVGSSDGQRHITKLGNADDALAVAGTEDSVQESTADAVTGDRTVSIASGDLVVICRRGSIIEYNADELDASLATPPTVGTTLGVLGSKFSTAAAAASGVASPVIGMVHMVNGDKVAIELVL